MVKFRELINTSILNDEKWIGFLGDSEYVNDKGELVMGMWAFIDVIDNSQKTYITLDANISEEMIKDWNNWNWLVMNDNGHKCEIKLFYNVDDMPTIMNGNRYVE